MNSIQFSTDKVILTVFVTVLVGFLTAAMSIVRLVNDKESKTTDYRQTWTDSLRKCFAALISNITTLASLTTSRMSSADGIGQLIAHEFETENPKLLALGEKNRAYLDKKVLEEDSHLRDVRRAMHESYALTRLHFKPNDLSFSRVEQKFDVVLELFAKLAALSDKDSEGDRLALREKIHSAAGELTAFSRDILKTEWEAVKLGELAYQRTKFWSIVGGAVALFGLAIFGLATAWSLLRSEPPIYSLQTAVTPSGRQYEVATTAPVAVEVVRAESRPPIQTTQSVTVYSAQPQCAAAPLQLRQPKPYTQSACK